MSFPKFHPLCCLTSLRNFYVVSGSTFSQSQHAYEEITHPEAYKLLSGFKPGAQKSHIRKTLLKAMQIKAGLALGCFCNICNNTVK